MARAATDADFNKSSRYLAVKLEIYFNGMSQPPFVALKSDYLIDADWLEEGSADSSSLFGTISSNELSFRLLNKNGMFSPTNAAGPYYGKIKAGIPVIPFIKPIYDNDDVEWTQLGKFYTTGWDAQVTGTYADIVANDVWYNIFKQPVPNYPVALNKTYKQFLVSVFTLLGYDVTVSDDLDAILAYCFIDGNIKECLQDVIAAAIGYLTTSKTGDPIIGALTASGPLRATLTDGDQIKTVSSKQSITKSYDGVSLTYSIPQVSAVDTLVDMTGLTVPVDGKAVSNAAFSKGPMWQISSIYVNTTSDDVSLAGYTATPWLMSFLLDNTGIEVAASVTVYGTVVELTDIIIADDVTKIQSVSSKYIQNSAYATTYKDMLTRFVTSTTPVITITVRGNPLLKIGDRVLVQSTKYNLNFNGIIQRMSYSYAGSLACEMVLLNADVLQGV